MFVLCFLVVSVSALAMGQAPQQEKIDAVLAGNLKEARASWWGFDAGDSTKILQAALDSKVPKLIVDAMPSPWITNSLFVHDNQEIVFEKNCVLQAKRGGFRGTNDSLLNVIIKKNVKISGEGAVLRMWIKDYQSSDYVKAEWRHGISIISSENVTITGVTVTDTGGDGIYIGDQRGHGPCKNIHIANVTCDNNHRQGISVINVEKLLIEKTVMRNTRGTNPEAGIDFEPDRPDQRLVDIVMRDCVTENNAGAGYSFYLVFMDSSSQPVSVRLENCISKNDGTHAFLLATRNGKTKSVPGRIEVVNCEFENSGHHGIYVRGKAVDGIDLSFTNVAVRHCGRQGDAFPIQLASASGDEFPVGNITFDRMTVTDAKDRPFLNFSELSSTGLGLRQVTGAIDWVRDGKRDSIKIDEAWIDKHFPRRVPKDIPVMELDQARLIPLRPVQEDNDRRLPVLKARSVGTFLFYAQQGQTLSFSLRQGQVSAHSYRERPVSLLFPSGQSLGVPPLKTSGETEYRLDSLPETGIYRLHVDVSPHWVALLKSNSPVVVAAVPNGVDLFTTTGEFYFYVPKGTEEFGLRVSGGGVERVKVTLFDPSGKEVWIQDNIEEVVPFEASAPGLWKVKFDPPSRGILEDFRISLVGIPPLVGFSPDSLLQPSF